MSGRLFVVGLGPGNEDQTTPEVREAVDISTVFFGYVPYLDRLALRADQKRHASDNRQEIDRARAALEAAQAGETVCVVSGGDPGIFAMAAAVCEAIDKGPSSWRSIDITVFPGVTAMSAAAARIGAPLGNDFCAISLSDNLKPWQLIEKRLSLAAQAGFVIALYNPISKARPWQLGKAFEIVRQNMPLSVPVIFARAIGRADERVQIVPLAEAQAEQADMATCVIIGTDETRFIERDNKPPLVYTPRFIGSKASI